ncbi:MAG: WD40 repeat domain-containing protein [Oceanicaulis sp.]|nr:WD40 repeat domain-containing protein [Oceanicaulis sp.]
MHPRVIFKLCGYAAAIAVFSTAIVTPPAFAGDQAVEDAPPTESVYELRLRERYQELHGTPPEEHDPESGGRDTSEASDSHESEQDDPKDTLDLNTRLMVGHSGMRSLSFVDHSWTTVGDPPGVSGTVTSIARSPNGDSIAIGHSSSPFLTILEAETGSKRQIQHSIPGPVNGLAYSPDGQHLAIAHSSSPNLTLLDTETLRPVHLSGGVPNNANDVDFHPSGRYLAVAHLSGNRLTVFDTHRWAALRDTPPFRGSGLSVKFSPDGRELAVGHSVRPRITFLDVASGFKERDDRPEVEGPPYDIAYSQDGSYLAIATRGRLNLQVFHRRGWAEVHGTPALPDRSAAVLFTPDGRHLLVGHRTAPYLSTLRTSSWTQIQDVPELSSSVTAIAWDPAEVLEYSLSTIDSDRRRADQSTAENEPPPPPRDWRKTLW